MSITAFSFSGAMQFKNPHLDSISAAVTPIELLFNNNLIAHGTGFIWKSSQDYFLITNWHNLSGQDPFSGERLNDNGSIPESIRIYPSFKSQSADMKKIFGNTGVGRRTLEMPLYEHFDKPHWLQHNQFSALRIDIVAIKLPPIDEELLIVNADEITSSVSFSHVGSEVFVVGYPFSDLDQLVLKYPIWKRGSIASDTVFGWKGKPTFLIDAATRKGMSGSPVLRRVFGPTAIINKNEQFEIKLDNVIMTEFVGVYAGHLSSKEAAINIGYAWYGKLVEQIVPNGVSGSRL